MNTTIISIEWQGPRSIDEVTELNDENKDYGIYQVYGTHPVYGRNALFYIGKACDQTFAVRIRQEDWETWEDYEGRVEFRVGRLGGDEMPSESRWNQMIDQAESILINSHKPARNASGIGNLSDRKDRSLWNVHVLNWGEYGSLLPEASGARWTWKLASDKYDIFTLEKTTSKLGQ